MAHAIRHSDSSAPSNSELEYQLRRARLRIQHLEDQLREARAWQRYVSVYARSHAGGGVQQDSAPGGIDGGGFVAHSLHSFRVYDDEED